MVLHFKKNNKRQLRLAEGEMKNEAHHGTP